MTSPFWKTAAYAGLWFSMTATTLWALGVDPITAVRYAWVPLVTVFGGLGVFSHGVALLAKHAHDPKDGAE